MKRVYQFLFYKPISADALKGAPYRAGTVMMKDDTELHFGKCRIQF